MLRGFYWYQTNLYASGQVVCMYMYVCDVVRYYWLSVSVCEGKGKIFSHTRLTSHFVSSGHTAHAVKPTKTEACDLIRRRPSAPHKHNGMVSAIYRLPHNLNSTPTLSWMPFLPPSQQRQSTEERMETNQNVIILTANSFPLGITALVKCVSSRIIIFGCSPLLQQSVYL